MQDFRHQHGSLGTPLHPTSNLRSPYRDSFICHDGRTLQTSEWNLWEKLYIMPLVRVIFRFFHGPMNVPTGALPRRTTHGWPCCSVALGRGISIILPCTCVEHSWILWWYVCDSYAHQSVSDPVIKKALNTTCNWSWLKVCCNWHLYAVSQCGNNAVYLHDLKMLE